jgi:hypothetical protein
MFIVYIRRRILPACDGVSKVTIPAAVYLIYCTHSSESLADEGNKMGFLENCKLKMCHPVKSLLEHKRIPKLVIACIFYGRKYEIQFEV